MTRLEYYLHFFGYAKHEGSQESLQKKISGELKNYEFYDYQGKATKEAKDAYLDFLQLNELMLQKRLKQKQTGQVSAVKINHGSEGISMLHGKKVQEYVDLLDLVSIRDEPVLDEQVESGNSKFYHSLLQSMRVI